MTVGIIKRTVQLHTKREARLIHDSPSAINYVRMVGTLFRDPSRLAAIKSGSRQKLIGGRQTEITISPELDHLLISLPEDNGSDGLFGRQKWGNNTSATVLLEQIDPHDPQIHVDFSRENRETNLPWEVAYENSINRGYSKHGGVRWSDIRAELDSHLGLRRTLAKCSLSILVEGPRKYKLVPLIEEIVGPILDLLNGGFSRASHVPMFRFLSESLLDEFAEGGAGSASSTQRILQEDLKRLLAEVTPGEVECNNSTMDETHRLRLSVSLLPIGTTQGWFYCENAKVFRGEYPRDHSFLESLDRLETQFPRSDYPAI